MQDELMWLEEYEGQTTSELIDSAKTHDIASIVSAFHQGLGQKACKLGRPESPDEQIISSILALDQEVKNGGFAQFLKNASARYSEVVVEALQKIGCSGKADISQKALSSVPANWQSLTIIKLSEVLGKFDSMYYQDNEDVDEFLFRYICENSSSYVLP